MEIKGRNTTIGVMVDLPGHADFADGAAHRPALTTNAVEHNILDHHNGVVDRQTHRRGGPPRVIS
jgi:hypothetical protein